MNYSKTRSIYTAHRKAGYSKAFRVEHKAEILLHLSIEKELGSEDGFDNLGFVKGKRIPTVTSLRTENADLLIEKKEAYAQHRAAKAQMRERPSAPTSMSS